MSTKTLFTVEQFLALPDDEKERYELDEGELIPMAWATPKHNLGRDRLNRLWFAFLEETRLGVVISETPFRLPGDNARIPDLVYYTAERWKAVDQEHVPIDTPPDIAVEVISASDRDINRKVKLYFEAGVREVWLLYLSDHELHIRRPSSARILGPGDTLDSPEILPGFSIPVASLFEDLATV